jgi:ribosome-associated translation inhibitor RaiA
MPVTDRKERHMPQMAFEFEFYSEDVPNPQLEDDMRAEAGRRMRELATGQDDMVGASVAVEKPAHGETAYLYEARVVAYIKPENIVAAKKADGAMTALQEALDAVERKVRERRERLRKPWEQP